MSKGLEALDGLRFDVSMAQYINYLEANKECDIIEKELKALEMLKKKKVNLFHIWVFNDYEQYKEHYPFAEYNVEEDMLSFEEFELLKEVIIDFDTTKEDYLVKFEGLTYKELENENELLKEIIRSFFDRGCPLHQYIDKDFGLAIEVDNECSTMILGEFKGVDLDKKLKEVLENDK